MANPASPMLSPLLLLLLFYFATSIVESHRHAHHDPKKLQHYLQDDVSVTDEAGPWNGFKLLQNAKLGDVRARVGGLKSYLVCLSYIDAALHTPPLGSIVTDNTFDIITQNAVTLYQRSFGIAETGTLDITMLEQMIVPRCGRQDIVNGTLVMLQKGVSPGTQHWSASPGNPRWEKQSLTYVRRQRHRAESTQTTMDRAFATWAVDTSLTFTSVADVSGAVITINFRSGDHGDANSFDGQFGVLAHAFLPPDGRLHFDAEEAWSLDVTQPTSGEDSFDLLSVAVHEIGHLLGLEHSSDAGAIMYPGISNLEEKRALNADDIAGVQALYGADANPSPAGNESESAAVPSSWRRLRGWCGRGDGVVAGAAGAGVRRGNGTTGVARSAARDWSWGSQKCMILQCEFLNP